MLQLRLRSGHHDIRLRHRSKDRKQHRTPNPLACVPRALRYLFKMDEDGEDADAAVVVVEVEVHVCVQFDWHVCFFTLEID
jgi:hypothetical protein